MRARTFWKTVTVDRQKDLADIARLLEAHPESRRQVPADILARLES